jgi:hypothetical protein
LHVADVLDLLWLTSCEVIHFCELRESFYFLRDVVSICAICVTDRYVYVERRGW